MRVEDAFVVAVSRSRAKEAHGKWIPAQYWLEKLQHVLSGMDIFIKLTPKQLLSKLEKRGFLDREFILPMDECFSPVTRIHSNHKKLSVGVEDTKEKTIYFLFLESKGNQPPSWSTLPMWQGYYDNFMRRQTHRLRVERRQSEEEPTTTMARSVTPTELTPPTEFESTPPGATPPLDNDLKAILEPFFVELSSFKGDNIGLRKAIQNFGCRQQLHANEKLAELKGDTVDLTLTAVNSHKGFLDRYCCPPRKSCIQSFIALATLIDKEQPAGVDIFQLTKRGGKGSSSGNKLVPIIPTKSTEPRSYPDNAKQWLPRVLDASVAADSNRYHACFLLCKALERMEPKAVNDVWRTSSNRGTGKMDINRQIAMTDRANLTYTQLRVIRPFFIADKVNPLHSEHEIRKLELKSSHNPVFIQFKEDQYSRNGWYLPVDKVIKGWLEQSSSENNSPSTLHVILSADHGQGHWKANVACVLIQNNRVLSESNTVIASVECRKDKRQVLIDCGVPAKINRLLNKLKESRHGDAADGAVGISAVPIKLFAAGDLAWF